MFTINPGPWTLGVLIGIPIAAVIVIICLVVAVMARSIVAVGLAIAVVFIAGIAMWPWQASYHRYYDVSGTVTNVNHRLVTSGSGDNRQIEDKYVVALQGTTTAFGIKDTRASLLKAGDTVHIRCLRVYVFRSTNNGYDCKWGG